MRFRFLGDGDCPDWLLAEINTLSRMTSIKMKLLGQLVVKSFINNNELDEDKIKKLAQDTKLEFRDVKAAVMALELMLTSSARYGVNATDLCNELQQLGLPREHGVAIGRLYTDYYSRILDCLTARSLRLNRLNSVEIISGEKKERDSSPFIKLSLKLKKLDDTESNVFINVAREDIFVLLEEMKKARAIMNDF
ncbi:hypothetical protein PV327_009882 [Microctonus hyperodae]|uniref:COMM domain-containing protein 4 n=1 Tax=Microctonus hyperodae TaxID=165561 RepID=A0AA39KG12_MICHY|nr:hypothetical protein PV327_009882 [Microctonus hyperodae]